MATPKRPLSPFMLGTYYRFQLTSVSSFLHRASGVVLALGALVFAGWLVAAAGHPAGFAHASALLASLPGKIALFAFSAALVYHFLNGLRHLAWDAGWGFDIPKAYASGYAVLVLAVLLTGLLWFVGLSAGGAA